MLTTKETERSLRTAIVAVCLAGVRDRNPGAVANGIVSLVGACLPAVIERRRGVEFRPWQRLYVETGMLTHALGMLGPYDDTWWWDHLTHTHSATILGGVIHVLARQHDRDPRPRVLGGVAVAGVLWELGEYVIHVASRRAGLEPILVSYGPVDAVLDVAFDLLGASLVVGFADDLLGNLADREDGERRRDGDRPRTEDRD